MAIKGLASVRGNMQRILTGVVPEKAHIAMQVTTSIIGGYANMMTPIDTSFLINSQYRRVTESKNLVIGTIGYLAKYAGAVHEKKGNGKGLPRPNGNGNYWDPDAEPKFLSKAGDDNIAEIDRAVKEAMKV